MTITSTSMAIHEFLVRRAAQCREEEHAYRRWVDFLAPFRWAMVGGAAFLSAAAGATILKDPGFLGPTAAALMAFAAAALTATHTALRCDFHQGECQRLVQAFRSLANEYEGASVADGAYAASQKEELEIRYAEVVRTAGATPPAKYYGQRA
jgi:hypothetical protein